MDNVIGPLLSRFGAILGKLFGHPFDFLAGKSCSTVCGPTWDLSCYIENFCISHLLKLAMVSILLYFVSLVLLFGIQIGHMWVHLSHALQKYMDMLLYMFFSLRLLLHFFMLQQKRPRRRRHQIIDIEEEGEGSLYHSKIIKGRRRTIRDQRKEFIRCNDDVEDK